MALPQTSLPQVKTNCIAWQLLKSAYPKDQGYFRMRGFLLVVLAARAHLCVFCVNVLYIERPDVMLPLR